MCEVSIVRGSRQAYDIMCSCRGNNQRLEYLGDAVLQLLASLYLLVHYTEFDTGRLSVCSPLVHAESPLRPLYKCTWVRYTLAGWVRFTFGERMR